MKKGDKYTFIDVMEDYYTSQNPDCTDKNFSDATLKQFSGDNSKKWNELIHALDLDEEIEKIKHSGEFLFDEDDKKFIISMLKEFTKKLSDLRRGQIGAVDPEFRIFLFEGFYNMFRKNLSSQDAAWEASFKIYDRLDIPTCKIEAICTTNTNKLREMVSENIHTAYWGMDSQLKYTWLTAFAMDYKKFLEKWSELFCFMSEERLEEINEHAKVISQQMSLEQKEYAELEFVYADEINDAIAQDDNYQELFKQYCKMKGEQYVSPPLSKDVRKFVENYQKTVHRYKKRPFVNKIEKDYYELNSKLYERQQTIKQEVLRRHIPNYVIPNDDIEDNLPYFAPEKVLENAINRQKADWAFNFLHRTTEPVDLPDMDIEELKKHLKPFE